MPPIFIILYALICLAALFLIYFYILRHYGLPVREAVYAIFWCLLAGVVMSVIVDFSSGKECLRL